MVAFWFHMVLVVCSLFLILMGCYSVWGMVRDFRRGREFVRALKEGE